MNCTPAIPQTPEQILADEVDATKYRQPGETLYQKVDRIALNLSDDFGHEQKLRDILGGQRFLPAGRVQAAVGAKREVTPYNCFVSATVQDSFDSIMQNTFDAGKTMRLGGGIGFDWSHLRPRDDIIRSLQSKASGPVSFMHIPDAVCKTIASAGHRRGAMMAVLRVDHPDIEEFIRAKRDDTSLTGFNISVAVTDEFMKAVKDGTSFDLRFEGKVYQTIDARTLWDEIMMSNWDWAEPGILFIDRINATNNLRGLEVLAATNPCAEQPLPPNGACLLGSWNLTKYLVKTYDDDMRTAAISFDWEQFEADIPHVVRAMDNIIDDALYPLKAQAIEAKQKRRMGLGVTGMANTLEMMGYKYGSEDYIRFQTTILKRLAISTYEASIDIAVKKGPYPLWNSARMTQGFLQTMCGHVSDDHIEKLKNTGIRNSHLTSIAPTGTISITAGNVSSGIEPTFARIYKRRINMPDGEREVALRDYAFARGYDVTTADEVSAEDHVKVLCAAQEWVDSAVSKTCNVGDDVSYDAFKDLYMQAYDGGAKGCTTFRISGKRYGILNQSDLDPEVTAGEACFIDPSTGQKECG